MFKNFKHKEFESPGESFGGVLNAMFSVKSGDWKSIALFILTLALFGWTIDSFLPIIHDAVLIASGWQSETFKPAEEFSKHFLKLLAPFGLFLTIIISLYVFRRRNLRPVSYEVTNSKPRKYLIYMLSTYNPRNSISLEELMNRIDAGTLDLNDVLEKTNWGNLAFTAAFHAPVLERCSILTTAEASELFDEAEKLIKYIVKKQTGNRVECIKEKISDNPEDSNDIGKVANKIKNIYQKLDAENYNPEDVVANITGGTSAMSGGMILATLAENINIEYVRQGVDLTEDMLKTGDIMLAPKTNYRLAK
jgi:hypothetical protein